MDDKEAFEQLDAQVRHLHLRPWTRDILDRIAGLISMISHKIYLSDGERRLQPWLEAQGDRTLRLDYDLCEASTVIDLGGYLGQWSSDIFAKYRCNIHVFEPVPHFVKEIERRFAANPKISVHPFGLGAAEQTGTIAVFGDGSSLFKKGGTEIVIQIRCAAAFLEANDIRFVDLMKINIEGGEYDLLDHLIESGFVSNIGNIQVQFHNFVPDAECRMKEIRSRLQKTHHPTFQFSFVWENWALNRECQV